jgi:hypothetical protein
MLVSKKKSLDGSLGCGCKLLIVLLKLVELSGIEPLTSTLPVLGLGSHRTRKLTDTTTLYSLVLLTIRAFSP